jgi:predicted nucleic acid-binding protein
VLIDCAEILPSLFDQVLVPFAARDELIHPGAPKKVKDWILHPRAWLKITPVANVQPVRGLHKGETEALRLAVERKAAAILIDDMDGRAAARRIGLAPIFTVAILELAAEKRMLDLALTIGKLRQTSFFISPGILDSALERDGQRREKQK